MTVSKDLQGNTNFRSAKQPAVTFFFGKEDTAMYFDRNKATADGLLYCVLNNDIRFRVKFSATIISPDPLTLNPSIVNLRFLLIGKEVHEDITVNSKERVIFYSIKRKKYIDHIVSKADRERIKIALTNIIKVSPIKRIETAF